MNDGGKEKDVGKALSSNQFAKEQKRLSRIFQEYERFLDNLSVPLAAAVERGEGQVSTFIKGDIGDTFISRRASTVSEADRIFRESDVWIQKTPAVCARYGVEVDVKFYISDHLVNTGQKSRGGDFGQFVRPIYRKVTSSGMSIKVKPRT